MLGKRITKHLSLIIQGKEYALVVDSDNVAAVADPSILVLVLVICFSWFLKSILVLFFTFCCQVKLLWYLCFLTCFRNLQSFDSKPDWVLYGGTVEWLLFIMLLWLWLTDIFILHIFRLLQFPQLTWETVWLICGQESSRLVFFGLIQNLVEPQNSDC